MCVFCSVSISDEYTNCITCKTEIERLKEVIAAQKKTMEELKTERDKYAVYYVENFPKESSAIINDNQKTIANLIGCNGILHSGILRNRICELEKENKFHSDRTNEIRRMYSKSETENKDLKFSIAGIKDFLSVSDS